ncbi:MAG TPA: MerR family transcriptional regulator [Solirubrobacterales bacterium]|nr:MerR family transcriptional regulator [Solirubrobacterales bacterium]
MEASSTPFDRSSSGSTAATRTAAGSTDGAPSNRKALTIGAVAKILGREFEEISISKIRYLEDQKLLSPRRTPGGYRLYSQADVERLRTILRMQRDEFLPLRVIRQELAAGAREERGGTASLRRATAVEAGKGSRLTIEELVDQTGVGPALIKELEDWRLVTPDNIEGTKLYDDTDREIVKACSELARFGVGGRNLKVLRTAADRESALLEAVVGASLRSSNHNRRREAIENLESLAAACNNLTHMLLVRDLRKLTGEE